MGGAAKGRALAWAGAGVTSWTCPHGTAGFALQPLSTATDVSQHSRALAGPEVPEVTSESLNVGS